MATAPLQAESAPVILPNQFPPMPAVARILSRYDRSKVEAFIEVAIGLLDTLDRPLDPDEPDFSPRSDGAPGDADDVEPDGDDCGDCAWSEWDRRHATGKRAGVEAVAMENCGRTEDDEDDDPSGVCDEDGINTEFAATRSRAPGCSISDPDHGQDDLGEEQREEQAFPAYGVDQTQPLEPEMANNRAIAEPFLDRVRRERCQPYTNVWGERVWRLTNSHYEKVLAGGNFLL